MKIIPVFLRGAFFTCRRSLAGSEVISYGKLRSYTCGYGDRCLRYPKLFQLSYYGWTFPLFSSFRRTCLFYMSIIIANFGNYSASDIPLDFLYLRCRKPRVYIMQYNKIRIIKWELLSESYWTLKKATRNDRFLSWVVFYRQIASNFNRIAVNTKRFIWVCI